MRSSSAAYGTGWSAGGRVCPGSPTPRSRWRTSGASLAVLFRAMGGDPGLELVAGSERTSHHRLRLVQRLGMSEERLLPAERTAELVLLPPVLDCLPTATLNRDLYVWLVAFLAEALPLAPIIDPLQRDLARLRRAAERTQAVLRAFPGLVARHATLAAAHLERRPARRLPPVEAEVEALIRHLHGSGPAPPLWARATVDVAAPRGYRPFLPSPLWGEIRFEGGSATAPRDEAERGSAEAAAEAERHRRARRREPEHGERTDPLTLINKGEYLLLAAEAVNVSRPDDDEDPDAARRAADDMDELTLGSTDRSGREPRADESRSCRSLPPRPGRRRHAALPSLPGVGLSPRAPTGRATARSRSYRLRTRARTGRPTQPPDAISGWSGAGSRRCGRGARCCVPRWTAASSTWTPWSAPAQTSPPALPAPGASISTSVTRSRDLAIAILVDTSFSTDSWVDGRRVLDVEKAALTALAVGLDTCGDPFAILTFSSRKRQAVSVDTVKGFDERLDADGAPAHRRPAARARTPGSAPPFVTSRPCSTSAPSAIACCCCCPTASPTTSTTTRAATPSRTAARPSRRRAAAGSPSSPSPSTAEPRATSPGSSGAAATPSSGISAGCPTRCRRSIASWSADHGQRGEDGSMRNMGSITGVAALAVLLGRHRRLCRRRRGQGREGLRQVQDLP